MNKQTISGYQSVWKHEGYIDWGKKGGVIEKSIRRTRQGEEVWFFERDSPEMHAGVPLSRDTVWLGQRDGVWYEVSPNELLPLT